MIPNTHPMSSSEEGLEEEVPGSAPAPEEPHAASVASASDGACLAHSETTELKRLAQGAIREEDFPRALRHLDACIAACPSPSAGLYRLRCTVLLRLGEHARCLRDAESIADLEPGSLTSFYYKGSALYQTGQFSDAARTFEQGLKINPDDKALRDGFRNALTMIPHVSEKTHEHGMANQTRHEGSV